VKIKNASNKKSDISVTIAGENTSLPFAVSGTTCTTPLLPGKSCTVEVTFSPTDFGVLHPGMLTINDNAMNAPQMVPLSGTGKEPKVKK